jgi:hypothetical protein
MQNPAPPWFPPNPNFAHWLDADLPDQVKREMDCSYNQVRALIFSQKHLARLRWRSLRRSIWQLYAESKSCTDTDAALASMHPRIGPNRWVEMPVMGCIADQLLFVYHHVLSIEATLAQQLWEMRQYGAAPRTVLATLCHPDQPLPLPGNCLPTCEVEYVE